MKRTFIYLANFFKAFFRQLFTKGGIEKVESENRKAARALPSELRRKMKLQTGEFIKMCPGKRHAWFNSEIGAIRRPYIEGSVNF